MHPKELSNYIKYFRHFAERLSLRYNILISMDEYIELCSKPITVIDTERERGQILKMHGYLDVNEIPVKVIKKIKIPGHPLVTSLPKTHRFNIDPKFKDKLTTINNEPNRSI